MGEKRSTSDDDFIPVREGFLGKRGAKGTDAYLPRWTTLWKQRIGYTMKVSSGKYCNFIPLEQINEVIPASDWTDDPEQVCDFVILTAARLPPVEKKAALCCSEPEAQLDPDEDAAYRRQMRPRPYYLRAADVVERNQWMRDIRKAVRKRKAALKLEAEQPKWRKKQVLIRQIYTNDFWQSIFSFLILANFFANAYEAQILPTDNSNEQTTFNSFDTFFTAVFTVELAWNMASHWFWPFLNSFWNMFDSAIIAISLVSLANILPANLNVLRAIRAIRVFRLFRRLDALKQILISLGYAVKPVASAALFVLIFSSLYAVIGVVFFSEPEELKPYFGDFLRAQLTLMQVMTFDGWIDSICREMIRVYGDDLGMSGGAVAYIVTYNLIAGLVLLNVVMAILVEAFNEAKEQVAVEREALAARDLLTAPVSEPMEGLIREWARIKDPDSLNMAIESVFQRMDVNGDKSLSLQELQEGLWNISVEPRNQLSDEDFERYTEDRKYCEPDGGMALEGFRQMVVGLILAFTNKTGAWANRKVNRYTGRETGAGSKGYLSIILDLILGEANTTSRLAQLDDEDDEDDEDVRMKRIRQARIRNGEDPDAIPEGAKINPFDRKASLASIHNDTNGRKASAVSLLDRRVKQGAGQGGGLDSAVGLDHMNAFLSPSQKIRGVHNANQRGRGGANELLDEMSEDGKSDTLDFVADMRAKSSESGNGHAPGRSGSHERSPTRSYGSANTGFSPVKGYKDPPYSINRMGSAAESETDRSTGSRKMEADNSLEPSPMAMAYKLPLARGARNIENGGGANGHSSIELQGSLEFRNVPAVRGMDVNPEAGPELDADNQQRKKGKKKRRDGEGGRLSKKDRGGGGGYNDDDDDKPLRSLQAPPSVPPNPYGPNYA